MNTHLQGFCVPQDDGMSAVSIVALMPTVELGEVFGRDAADWLTRQGFIAKPGKWGFFPTDSGMALALGVRDADDWRAWADAAYGLPEGCYQPTCTVNEAMIRGWGSGSYRYNSSRKRAQLCLTPTDRGTRAYGLLRAEYLTRWLIDCPANRLTTTRLSHRVRRWLGVLAPRRLARVREVVGRDLLRENFPLIYHVGKASAHPPRLLEMLWGSPADNPDAPLLTLIGKGVCFDSGGLDIKPRSAMLNMKKDMGGAAHAAGLAAMVLQVGFEVRLRLILGIAENAISADAMRPGDVLIARDGTSIEVGDTDAEGRLVLADCFSFAGEMPSRAIIDFATLTGAARVALGTDLPALFCNDDALAAGCSGHGDDPLWRMPLHGAYAADLKGTISDLNSAPGGGYGGAIGAALFLEHFVPENTSWAHIDLMAYAPKKIPGRCVGAAAQGLYACLRALQDLSGC